MKTYKKLMEISILFNFHRYSNIFTYSFLLKRVYCSFGDLAVISEHRHQFRIIVILVIGSCLKKRKNGIDCDL